MHADYDAEKAVIGRVLAEGITPEVADLKPEDFAHPKHLEIWRSIRRLEAARQPVDMLTVSDDLKVRGALADVGGPAFLMGLAEGLEFNLPARLAVVRDRAQRRAVVAAAQQAVSRVADLNLRPEQVALELSALLAQLGAAVGTRRETFADALTEFLDRMDAIRAGKDSGYVRTGIGIWDELLGGLCRGQLILLGAYPSVGKGAVMGRMLLNMAPVGIRAGLFSLEDPKTWLAKRYVSNGSGVPVRRLMQAERLPKFADDAIQSAVMGASSWADNITINDASALSDDQIAAGARQMVAQSGAQAIFIDNASEVSLDGGGDRHDLRTARMVRLFRNVAKDLDVPVLLAVHFKRPKGNVTKEPRFIRPTSDMFKNSGAFEEAARVAVALWLDEQHPKDGVVATVLKQTEGEKDFDFWMPMCAYSGLVENDGGRKRDGEAGYTQNPEVAA